MKIQVIQHPSPKGRSLVACVDIASGEELFEEEPLVSAQFLWNTLYKYRACEHCLKALETAQESCRRLANQPALELPHPECCSVNTADHVSCVHCMVPYCSAACRDKAWLTYHKTLCLGAAEEEGNHPLNRLAEAWRNIHFPPESCSILLFARMVATVKQAAHPGAVLAQFSQFCKATVNEEQQIAHKLLGNEFQGPLEMLRTLAMEALYDDTVQQWFTPEGFSSMFALIGTNGQGIGTSSLSGWVKKCEDLNLPTDEKDKLEGFIDQVYDDIDKVTGEFLNCEGSGLYLLQSACNHSCQPNAEVTFPNDDFKLSMKALQDIKSGEEVMISYLDECALERSRHSRQKILREHYLFHCQCTKCETEVNQPDVTSEEEMDDDDDDDDDDDET